MNRADMFNLPGISPQEFKNQSLNGLWKYTTLWTVLPMGYQSSQAGYFPPWMDITRPAWILSCALL